MNTITENPPLRVDVRNIPYAIDGGVGARLYAGLIVLGMDQTIEYEFRRILSRPGVALHHARLKTGTYVDEASLRDCIEGIEATTDLILPGVELDVVAFGCTSATMVAGEEEVFRRVQLARPNVQVTTPVTAARAAFEALGMRKLALLTPYPDDINQGLRAYFMARGLEVPVMGSFNEPDDLKAARIRSDVIRDAAIRLGREEDVDGVFVSCTSMRVADVADEIEAAIGKPVVASNQAMAWHCLRLGGVTEPIEGFGMLLLT